MNLLKRIPIKYLGELHDVRLINFSVDMEEVKEQVPLPIKIRTINKRAMISMVDVKLKNMRPSFVPSPVHFDYRHIAFRLLVDDASYNAGVHKGIYFLKSFTDKAFIVWGGKLLTEYHLESAAISEKDNLVEVSQGAKFVKYRIGERITPANDGSLYHTIGALDRAYSLLGTTLRVTQIQREKWPIQAVECDSFENTFFESARLEGAFKVFETIYYQWLPPKNLIV